MPKQTTPAEPAILFNVFIMTPVVICCRSEGEMEHEVGELESETIRGVKNVLQLLYC